MAILDIIVAPDPRLKITAKAVKAVDDDVRALMDDMLESMHVANGIGLAAPQVGDSRRVIVVDISRAEEEPDPIRMANPELLWVSDEEGNHEEGCLSLPEQYAEVERPESIRVRYLDRSGEEQELDATGMLATCIQHEMDHLDGILFVDHISPLKRKIPPSRTSSSAYLPAALASLYLGVYISALLPFLSCILLLSPKLTMCAGYVPSGIISPE